MIKRSDKKGESSTITIIIAIVLGIAVLVFLIFGFTSGWNNMWDRVSNLGGGKANLDTIASACSLACSTASVSDYCTTKRTVKFGEEVDTLYIIKGDGKAAATAYEINDDSKDERSATGTCAQFANPTLQEKFFKTGSSGTVNAAASELKLKFPGLNVASCPAITCPA